MSQNKKSPENSEDLLRHILGILLNQLIDSMRLAK